MKKIYVLDTNVLMQSPRALFGFADNTVCITGTTLQELDKHKSDSGEVGFNTRESIRLLDSLREKGNLLYGVDLPNGGCIKLVPDCEENYLPIGYSLSVPDNRIINTTCNLVGITEIPVILVTNDVSMRINATVAGKFEVQGYRNESITSDEVYSGKMECLVSREFINMLYQEREVEWEKVQSETNIVSSGSVPVENEYFIFLSYDFCQSALAKYRNGKVSLLNDSKLRGFNNVRGKNASQKMLMDALLAPSSEIPLVIAKGPAGTGKTFLAMACALDGTYTSTRGGDGEYGGILVTRANVLSDNDLGFLPGDLAEKMDPLVAPFLDNLKQIFEGKGKEKDITTAKQQIEYVLRENIVEICAVGYMRGRSISNAFLIIDEAQNLTVQQALELVTRAGEGTKIVLCGDPDQIDARYLDKRNNGLVFASEKMKGSPLCAQITFEQEESVRSPLAMEAAKRMTV